MKETKHKKINNPNYRRFLDDGIIDIVTLEQLNDALDNIKTKHKNEARSLLITLYYTGGRPVEVLNLKAKDVDKEKSYITVRLSGSKKGFPRKIYLPYRFKLVRELYNYSRSIYPDMYMFYHFRSEYKRKVNTKHGFKIRVDITDKLRYYVKKWFKNVIKGSISPYYLRHNRFSQLAEAGATLEDIRFLKGSRSIESTKYYVHLSRKKAENLAKKIK